MNDKLKNSVEDLLRRAEVAGATGSKADKIEIQEINPTCMHTMPISWIVLLDIKHHY
jgi:hypothetical protein